MFAFYNFMPFSVEIKKGEKIGQGIFTKYLKADNDDARGDRGGGFGSTG
jgi:dUTP pyrophosphatase